MSLRNYVVASEKERWKNAFGPKALTVRQVMIARKVLTVRKAL